MGTEKMIATIIGASLLLFLIWQSSFNIHPSRKLTNRVFAIGLPLFILTMIIWPPSYTYSLIAMGTLGIGAYVAQRKAYKMALNELNALNEYTQFLLFNREVYENHRTKFLDFVQSIQDKPYDQKAMMAHKVIENMANKGEGSFLLVNVYKRENPDKTL
jgi:hypothetical protein